MRRVLKPPKISLQLKKNMPWINPQGLGFRVTLVSCIPMYILLPTLIQVPNPVPFQSHPRGPAFAFSLSAFASFRDGRKTHLHTHLTRRLSCQRKKRGALKSSSSMHAHAVAVNANLQASAMSQGSSFVKAHAPPAFHSSTAIVGRMHVDGPPSRHDDVVVTLAPATPAHSAGAVNSTADVLDLMQDDDDDERYTSVTVTESPAATIPAEPSTAISGKVARSFRSFEDARAYVRTLGLKRQEEWWVWSKSDKRPHDIPSTPNVTYASSGWVSWSDFLGYAVGMLNSGGGGGGGGGSAKGGTAAASGGGAKDVGDGGSRVSGVFDRLYGENGRDKSVQSLPKRSSRVSSRKSALDEADSME